jgi:hypothetical protein
MKKAVVLIIIVSSSAMILVTQTLPCLVSLRSTYQYPILTALNK